MKVVPRKEVVEIEKCYELKLLESLTGNANGVRANFAGHHFAEKCLWSHYQIEVNRVYRNRPGREINEVKSSTNR